jgi:hypothetical protein
MSPVCQFEMTLPADFPGVFGVTVRPMRAGDGASPGAALRWGSAPARRPIQPPVAFVNGRDGDICI